MDHEIAVGPLEGSLYVMRNDDIVAFGMLSSEDPHSAGIKLVG